MNRAFILVGWKKLAEAGDGKTSSAFPEPVCLYCGLDGEALQAAAAKAADSKQYQKIGKIMNPQVVPLGIVPGEVKVTTPTFPERKPKEPPKVAQLPRNIQEQNDKLRKEREAKAAAEEARRQARFAPTTKPEPIKPEPVKPIAPVKPVGGKGNTAKVKADAKTEETTQPDPAGKGGAVKESGENKAPESSAKALEGAQAESKSNETSNKD